MIPSDINSFKFLVEANAFGVCTRLGEKLHMSTRHIRLFFIYASCLTIGSPVILYMILAFWMQMRYYVRGKRSPIWDY
jgi:phage shock protein C